MNTLNIIWNPVVRNGFNLHQRRMAAMAVAAKTQEKYGIRIGHTAEWRRPKSMRSRYFDGQGLMPGFGTERNLSLTSPHKSRMTTRRRSKGAPR